MSANLENSAAATRLEKVSFHSNPKKGSAKECSNYQTIALILHARKVMLKNLQVSLEVSLQQYMNRELPHVKARFRKAIGTKDQNLNISWIIGKAREFQKKCMLLLHWLCQSLWLYGSHQTGQFLKRWEYQTTLCASWETCMQVKKQHLEPYMEKLTGL